MQSRGHGMQLEKRSEHVHGGDMDADFGGGGFDKDCSRYLPLLRSRRQNASKLLQAGCEAAKVTADDDNPSRRCLHRFVWQWLKYVPRPICLSACQDLVQGLGNNTCTQTFARRSHGDALASEESTFESTYLKLLNSLF